MVTVCLALGANLGDRESNIAEAVRRLRQKITDVRVSSLIETEPWGYLDQPRFMNGACLGQTELSPHDLLAFVKSIEREMGREASFRNGPRPIDIDILLYDDRIVETPELTIPHPRMTERAFVLEPLAEIASALRHPVTGKTVGELLASLSSA